VHAAFEVAVAREHAADDELVVLDRIHDRFSGSGPELPMQVVQP
jgi:hypothetical protein